MSAGVVVRRWLAEPLPREVAGALARLEHLDGVRRIAVMPDVHLAEGVCVGTVLATEGVIYPEAVGRDIGCGMAAMRLRGDSLRLEERAAAPGRGPRGLQGRGGGPAGAGGPRKGRPPTASPAQPQGLLRPSWGNP